MCVLTVHFLLCWMFYYSIILICLNIFQNPNEDTEWNDILRKKGILPQKEPEVTEEMITEMMEQTIQEKQSAGMPLYEKFFSYLSV